ncbi:MAG: hypothetical protein ACJ71Q_17325 [Terriglobales bacterium]
MHSIDEIQDLLGDIDFVSRISRNLGSSTVALFAVFDDHGKDLLKLAGSGSLVTAGGLHGILTAAHVWEEVIKKAVKVGITRTDNIDHQYLMDVAAIVATVWKPTAPEDWSEHGPDLAFLRIPAVCVGEIQASQVFEHLDAPPKMLGVEGLECWFALGTPGELGVFTQVHASVEIRGEPVNPEYISGAVDYYEFETDTSSPGRPKSLGGCSGGGLWRVVVYSSPVTGKVDWAQRFKGVVFWEFPEKDGRRTIRCHGERSIAALVEKTKA